MYFYKNPILEKIHQLYFYIYGLIITIIAAEILVGFYLAALNRYKYTPENPNQSVSADRTDQVVQASRERYAGRVGNKKGINS